MNKEKIKQIRQEVRNEELRQIKEKGINNNREVRNGKESTKDLFKSLEVVYYD